MPVVTHVVDVVVVVDVVLNVLIYLTATVNRLLRGSLTDLNKTETEKVIVVHNFFETITVVTNLRLRRAR